jgi:hypothetical protein
MVRGLWTLPTNLIGHLAGWVVSGGRRPRRVGGPAAVGWLYPIRRGIGLDWVGAVTLGHAILYRRGVLEDSTATQTTPTATSTATASTRSLARRLTLAHELAHTRQHDRLGPLYLPLHLLAQAISAALSFAGGRRPTVSRVHDHNPLEQTFICLSAGATTPPLPEDIDVESYLAVFGA